MWRVLAALHHRDGLRISDLAGLTSIDISTLSRLIGKMEKRCLVTRRRSPEADGRVVTVVVTPAGQAATRAIVPVAQRYETMALAGFTADEAAALKQMLIRVYATWPATRSIPPPEGVGVGRLPSFETGLRDAVLRTAPQPLLRMKLK